MPPPVSVVVAVYQAAATLERSLASVLAQREPELELLVVDDGSTDAGPAMLQAWAAREPRLRVLRQPHAGLTRALQLGCAAARGEFLARHDADDLSLPGRLQCQVRRLRAEPGLAFVSCASSVLGPQDEPLYEVHGPQEASASRRRLLRGAGPPHGSVTMRRAAYDAVGGYRAAFRYAQDWDLWLRLIDTGGLAYEPELLYAQRVHAAATSASRRRQQQRLAHLARRCREARLAGRSETAWLEQAARVSAEAPPAGHDPAAASDYFIGKCLLDRGDVRALGYLARACRARPWALRARLAFWLARRRWRVSAGPHPQP